MSLPEHAEDLMEGEVGPNRKRMPYNREGYTCKLEIRDETDGQLYEGYLTANRFEDGSLGELFLAGFGKQGSTLEGWVQVAAILFSTAIQYGAEMTVLARKLSHTKFPPYGSTNHPDIPHCRSVPDFIMHWLVLKFGTPELWRELQTIDKKLEHLP